MDNNTDILKRIKNSVSSTAPNAILIVYGSYARGDFRPDSDIDLLILLDKEKISYEEKISIKYPLYHIEFETGILISPLILSKQVWETKHKITPFYENVTNEGKIL